MLVITIMENTYRAFHQVPSMAVSALHSQFHEAGSVTYYCRFIDEKTEVPLGWLKDLLKVTQFITRGEAGVLVQAG